jgi:glycosyltransferase involved in cell wall biosynthesis
MKISQYSAWKPTVKLPQNKCASKKQDVEFIMIGTSKVVVVMPAYNAEKTLRKTVANIDRNIADCIILVDDASSDETINIAKDMDLLVYKHDKNIGYGGNQKSCYRLALAQGADIIVMIHPDYQYDPRLMPAMAYMINSGVYDVVLGSRILGKGARTGGMPMIKYIANRFLTAFQNIVLREKLSEYHTGYRAFSKDVLKTLPLEENSDDFAFDNQMLCQIIAFSFRMGEISCPTRYFAEASSINMYRSTVYAFSVITGSLRLALHRMGFKNNRLYGNQGRKLSKLESFIKE